jgi:hypothetical protein
VCKRVSEPRPTGGGRPTRWTAAHRPSKIGSGAQRQKTEQKEKTPAMRDGGGGGTKAWTLPKQDQPAGLREPEGTLKRLFLLKKTTKDCCRNSEIIYVLTGEVTLCVCTICIKYYEISSLSTIPWSAFIFEVSRPFALQHNCL